MTGEKRNQQINAIHLFNR